MSALTLPDVPVAREPPEARGHGRDDVAMLVADRATGSLVHTRFRDLPRLLRAGDLLVVNISRTLPAALPALHRGQRVELRLSTPTEGDCWIVELRNSDGTPLRPPPTGTRLELPGGGRAELIAPFARGERLTIARLELDSPLEEYLSLHGSPIRYDYVPAEWPLEDYQTVFALEPGSAEMPSAARPFTPELVTELVSRGVLIAPITLHTGVSSPEHDEPPYLERFHVPAATARVVNAVRGWHGRVIAIGTTVVRALETTAAPDGTVAAGQGHTRLVIGPERGIRTVGGLLTGWHEPRSSHLQMIEALAGGPLIERSYQEALDHGYRWHEFGDLHLILL